MLPKRPKPTDGGPGSFANVIDLTAFRDRVQGAPRSARSATAATALYVTQDSKHAASTHALPGIVVEEVACRSQLQKALWERKADLVFLESELAWANTLEVISDICMLLEVPIILLCDGKKAKQKSTFLKEAYASGVHDIVFAPVATEDLLESVRVILKYRSAAKSI